MTDVQLDLLKVGTNVDIQRSDGRIHSAVVSGIALETGSVTVEWFEKGETKGKEIEIEAIFQLNPELLAAQNNNPAETRLTYHQQGSRPSETHSKETSRQQNGRRPTTSQVTSGGKLPRPSYARPAVGAASSSSHNFQNGSEDSTPSASDFSRKSGAPTPSAAAAAAAANQQRRKSNCVKEVEKIEERRRQRRENQKAIREAHEANYDTSNPNWEFEAMIRDYQDTLDYNPITNAVSIENHQICVCVRKRPMNKKEHNKRDVDVVAVPNKENVIVHEPKTKVDLSKYLENQKFRFDFSFDENASNQLVYKYTAKPLVESIFDKGMATCFAYGQTGSGKTHTMGGDFSGKGQQDSTKGIYALAANDVFKLLSTKYKKDQLVASASFFEIYSGKVFDLLNEKIKLRVLEDGKQQVQVVGLKEQAITCVEDVLDLINHGNSVRTSGVTSANSHSSRSHAVFQIILRKRAGSRMHGKFSLIDLAGNERGADTSSSDRQTRMEGAEINKSLLALKECIRALGQNGKHLPFRASKLTQVLKDSFIGDNSRTCMIAMISPGMSCCEHTLNTLRYADRVKELGPGGRVEGKPADTPAHFNPAMSPQNSDLYLLRNSNEEEVSQELLTFHEVVNHMQEQEEEILDCHRGIVDQAQQWQEIDKKLLKMANTVDYDVEAYVKQLESLLDTKLKALNSLKSQVQQIRKDLQEEENLSKNIKPNKKRSQFK